MGDKVKPPGLLLFVRGTITHMSWREITRSFEHHERINIDGRGQDRAAAAAWCEKACLAGRASAFWVMPLLFVFEMEVKVSSFPHDCGILLFCSRRRDPPISMWYPVV